MEIHCSFRKCSFRQCGSDLNCPADSVITPLLSHDRDIRSHLNACSLNGTQIKTEADLIRLRGGFFKSENTELTICQIHEKEFGIRWRRSRLCTLGYICGKNGKQSKAMTSCAIDVKQSQFISEMEGQLIPIGSGVCVQCRTELLKRIKEKAFSIQDQDEQDGCMEVACKDLGEVTVVSNNSTAMTENLVDDAVPVTPAQKEECHKNNPIDEINSVTASLEVSQDFAFSQTTCDSELSEWQDSQDSPSHKRKALDTFLAEIGISPIKKTLTVSFESASNRTKHDYLKKSKQIMHNILSIIAPKQETQLEDVLYNTKFDDDNSITESVAKAYSSMTCWGTQRQILSLLVQDHSFNELEQAIPTLSRYKYTAARKHAAITGIGMPIPKTSLTREKATKQQIEHFLEFVMSPAIMTDSPFGHCTYKITSGITLNVPKIILNSVRTRTVTLYTKYCEEINFNNLLSERSYMSVGVS